MALWKRTLMTVLLAVGMPMAASAQFVSKTQRLVISDIDDTLKISFVLSTSQMIANAYRVNAQFEGMGTLYSRMSEDHLFLPIYYVTNAPFFMKPLHENFLTSGGFPTGDVLVRKNPLERDFKIRKISEILNAKKPKEVLLVGDNGEADVQVYAQIRREFPQIKFTTLIHYVYSIKNENRTGKVLEKGDRAFITSLDAAAILNQTGWLSESALNQQLIDGQRMISEVTHRMSLNLSNVTHEQEEADEDKSFFVAPWSDCRGYNEKVPEKTKMMKDVMAHLRARCAKAVNM